VPFVYACSVHQGTSAALNGRHCMVACTQFCTCVLSLKVPGLSLKVPGVFVCAKPEGPLVCSYVLSLKGPGVFVCAKSEGPLVCSYVLILKGPGVFVCAKPGVCAPTVVACPSALFMESCHVFSNPSLFIVTCIQGKDGDARQLVEQTHTRGHEVTHPTFANILCLQNRSAAPLRLMSLCCPLTV
jgi:hypothetical protein